MTTSAGYTEKIWLLRPRNGINGKPFRYGHVHFS
jgi:hypothetical protein